MRSLKDIICEDFTLKGKGKINTADIEKAVNDIIYYFEIDKLASGDNSYKHSFITNKELVMITEKIEEFFNKINSFDPAKFIYTGNDNMTTNDDIIKKRYAYNSEKIGSILILLRYNDNTEILFRKDSLSLKCNVSKRIIGLGGPYGGFKVCEV